MTKSPPTRPDETPASFTDLKPPGYYSARLGYFVPVRIVPETEFDTATGRHVGPQPRAK